MSREFTEKHYFSTIDLWKHHNDTLLKWPQVIIGAAILFLASIVNNDKVASFLSNPQSSGNNNFSEVATGLLLILFGLSIISMLYVMQRARTVMTNIEAELSRLSLELFNDEDYFIRINHPTGTSGRTLIWVFMAFVLVPIMTILGFCILFGWYWGFIYWIPFAITSAILLSYGFIQEYKVKQSIKRSKNTRENMDSTSTKRKLVAGNSDSETDLLTQLLLTTSHKKS